ncbi:MAG: UTP--glucose-1-phosphate uridylyltransferase GalU [Solirubrobacterales bacterium]
MMQKRVNKAVVPAAGWGTRFLPATKAQPKEMLPIIDKPAIQYIIEEARAAGLNDVLVVTGKTKRAIEDHFDHAVELEAMLRSKGSAELLEMVQDISNLIDIQYLRQKDQLGLGHAVYCAHKFVHDEPFVVLLSDDIVIGEPPCLDGMLQAYAETGAAIIAVQRVPENEISSYGIVDPASDPAGGLFPVKGMVEKPEPAEAPSNLAVIGRYLLIPEIFPILSELPAGRGGEIQLTDALDVLAKRGKVFAYLYEGRRYDIGNKLGFLQATVDLALERADLGGPFLSYLREKLGGQ